MFRFLYIFYPKWLQKYICFDFSTLSRNIYTPLYKMITKIYIVSGFSAFIHFSIYEYLEKMCCAQELRPKILALSHHHEQHWSISLWATGRWHDTQTCHNCLRRNKVEEIQNWGALKQKYRHRLETHSSVFHAIANTIQLSIRNGEPLFEIEYNENEH